MDPGSYSTDNQCSSSSSIIAAAVVVYLYSASRSASNALIVP